MKIYILKYIGYLVVYGLSFMTIGLYLTTVNFSSLGLKSLSKHRH